MKLSIRNLKSKTAFLSTFALAVLLLFSCKKDDPYNFTDTLTSKVNLINAVPDASPITLYVENVLRTPNPVAYGSASGYNQTLPGPQNVAVKSASGEATLISTQAQFDVLTNYTFFLIGQNSAPGLITVTDDLTAPSAGKAKIRWVNTSPNSPGATLLFNNNITLFSAQDYRGISSYAEITPGAYTATIAVGTARSTGANVTFESGKIYTLYAKGLLNGTANSALTVSMFANN